MSQESISPDTGGVRPGAKSTHLTVQPDRCTGCGECLKVCVPAAIRLANAAVHVDMRVCTNCCECAAVCHPRAIQRAIVPLRSAAGAAVAPADVGKVVVGSRAEAKALRKAAEKSARQAAPARSAGPAGGGPISGRGVLRRRSRKEEARAAASPAAGSALPAVARAAESKALDSPRTGAAASPPFGTASWSLVDTGLVMVAGILAIAGKNAAMAIPAIGLMPSGGQALTRAGILALYYAFQLAALSILAGRRGKPLAIACGLRRDPEAGPRDAERPSVLVSAGLVLGLLVGVEAVAIAYGFGTSALGWAQPGTVSSDVSSVFGGGGAGLVLAGLMVALVAPFVEELAFRGVAMVAVAARWGAWPAILVQAVLFAAYHASAWLFFPMLVLGVALGWLAWSRRSLWPAIALHVLYNGLAVAVAAAFG